MQHNSETPNLISRLYAPSPILSIAVLSPCR